MSTIVETSYFNSFLLKKAGINPTSSRPPWGDIIGQWPGLPWNPTGYPTFPALANLDTSVKDQSWYVEESRIRGGYNNNQTELGPRAYLATENNGGQTSSNGIIFSGVFNSATGFNATNVFSIAENITKELDPRYGSIRKFYATDNDLRIFQDLKVSRTLVDKDAIFTADGNPQLTASTLVLGQNLPFAGEYGIGNFPESFAKKGFRSYFVDNNKGVVCRLSMDGITEISQYGMKDYFRDQFEVINNDFQKYGIQVANTGFPSNSYEFEVAGGGVASLEIGMNFTFEGDVYTILDLGVVTNFGTGNNNARQVIIDRAITLTTKTPFFISKWDNNKVVGAYDMYQDVYSLSIQTPNNVVNVTGGDVSQELKRTSETLSFDESALGWTSFYTYTPVLMESLNNSFISAFGNQVWDHYDQSVPHNSFYGSSPSKSSITFLFNQSPSLKKNFLTVNYEGSAGWQIDKFESGTTGQVENYDNNTFVSTSDTSAVVKSLQDGYYVDNITGQPKYAGFHLKENLYTANLINTSPIAPYEVSFGTQKSGIKGFFATVTISTDESTNIGGVKELWSVGSTFVRSS
jgi:hypothetical protein